MGKDNHVRCCLIYRAPVVTLSRKPLKLLVQTTRQSSNITDAGVLIKQVHELVMVAQRASCCCERNR